jgi:hypothetical protein
MPYIEAGRRAEVDPILDVMVGCNIAADGI